jgi:hypothetical protein
MNRAEDALARAEMGANDAEEAEDALFLVLAHAMSFHLFTHGYVSWSTGRSSRAPEACRSRVRKAWNDVDQCPGISA